MVIHAEEKFAQRTAWACVYMWDQEEIVRRAANWPPFFDDMVTEQIEKLAFRKRKDLTR